MHIRTGASISGLVTVLVTACAPPTPSTSPAPQVVTVGASASSSASPTDTPTDMSQALAAASASVGQIRSTTCDGGWTGTGFLVSDQLILTAAHVVEGAHALTITFPDDEPRPVFVVGYRPDNDSPYCDWTIRSNALTWPWPTPPQPSRNPAAWLAIPWASRPNMSTRAS